uniref:Uncharacterized protein n=1 Tax=Buteo japonicus TaxID=224669 RepID=A0A8C0HK26_9AVES
WQGVLLCAEPLQYVSLAPISFIKATVVSAKIYIICLRKISEHSEPALANSFLISLDAEEGTAVQYARSLEQFTRHPVLVLRGGYKRFSACYHFLRTQKILWMPQELDNFQPYPVEILPAKLYMGNFKQACDQQIQKDLKIKAQVNISEQPLSEQNLTNTSVEKLNHQCFTLVISHCWSSFLTYICPRSFSRVCRPSWKCHFTQ